MAVHSAVVPRTVGLTVLSIAASVALAAPALAATTVSDVPLQTASFNGTVNVVQYAGDTMYVGGAFTSGSDSSGTVTRNHVAAVSATTGQLLPWNPNTDDDVQSLTVAGSWVYLGGAFGNVGGATHKRIARMQAGSGAVDSGFKASAVGTVFALSTDGSSVFAGGTFTSVNGSPRQRLAAFNAASGALSAGWQPSANARVNVLTAASGRVYIGGTFTSVNGAGGTGHLAAVSPATGAVDGSYRSAASYEVKGIAVTSSAVYAAINGPGGRLLATNLSGAGQWTLTTDGGVNAVTVLGDAIYAGGHFDNACKTAATGTPGTCLSGSVGRKKLIATDTSGTLLDWSPNANSALGVYALDASTVYNRIAAGGAFTGFHFGSIDQPHFAEFG